MKKRPLSTTGEGPEDDVEMGFLDHLGELRKRLVRCLLALIPGVGVGWYYKEKILDRLVEPFAAAHHKLNLGEADLHFQNPMDGFSGYFILSLAVGLIFAAPVISWQVWAFISPGLYRREKRLAIPFVLAATVCFVGGVAFCYELVLGPTFETFLSFAGQLPGSGVRVRPTIMLSEYLDFATRFLLGFGATFEVPVVISFLAAAGIVNWRQLLKFGRWWLVIASVVAAALTPPDVGSQLLMMGPLVALYFLSVIIAAIIGPKAPAPVKAPKEEPEAA